MRLRSTSLLAVVAAFFAAGCGDLQSQDAVDVEFEELSVSDDGQQMIVDYQIDDDSHQRLDDHLTEPALRIRTTTVDDSGLDVRIDIERPSNRIDVDIDGQVPSDRVEISVDDERLRNIIVDEEIGPSLVVDIHSVDPDSTERSDGQTEAAERNRPFLGDRDRPRLIDRAPPRVHDRDQPDRGDRDRPRQIDGDPSSVQERDRPDRGDRDRPRLHDRDRPDLGDRDRPRRIDN